MKNLSLLLVLCLVLATGSLVAHGGTIKGIVVDAESNVELPGASLQLSNGQQTTTSNELGMFVFADLPGGEYTLYVSLVGYHSFEQVVRVPDHETTEIKISLKPTVLQLQDVEVAVQQSKPLSTLSAIDIRTRPIQSTQDMLRFVPGVVIAQHAGGGKAEQIFLRGFDIDHGTDIALFADGVPVNMVSHAHGQGYADLHFVIPELVQRIDFQKGPYYASVGNFNTAGYVKFETPAALESNFLSMEAGRFNTFRTVAAVDLLGKKALAKGANAYIAAETVFSEGYFEAPQDFKRVNLFAKYRQVYDEGKILTISGSRFESSWLASGQIPLRAVESGQIGHFGAIDSTEGGQTGRYNLNIEHLNAISDKTVIKNQFYLSQYDFELYSNFTFFLNDPVNGDQIRQKERRLMSGYNGAFIHNTSLAQRPLRFESGLQLRYDDVDDVELSRTKNRRQTLKQVALGDIQEINLSIYSDVRWQASERLSVNAGLRFDQFDYAYYNHLDSVSAFASTARNQINPKINLNYAATHRLSLYAQFGGGFHSNDARTVLGARAERILPRAWGYETGILFKPLRRMLLSVGVWNLDMEQEFVYVGDEGIVEAGGKTRRRGVDFSVRWQMAPWLYADADCNLTHARATEAPDGEQYIPLAPLRTAAGGFNFQSKKGWEGSLRCRYVGDRPANEDNSVVAEGFFLLDALLSYQPSFKNKKTPLTLTLSAQNLANRRWREAQFDTESRLFNEASPVSEIHYTPGAPLFLKGGLRFCF